MNAPIADHEIIDDAPAQSRPWLVMVHALSQDRRVFGAQAEAFRARFRLLLVDLPGHGRSATIPGPYGPEEHAGAVLAALNHAGVDTMHFWATHTGAAVGLTLATRHINRFHSLVLEGPVIPGVDVPYVIESIARVRAVAREHGLDAAREEWLERTAYFAVMRAEPERCRFAEHRAIVDAFPGGPWIDTGVPRAVEPSVETALGVIARPVLIVNGERDVPDFIAIAERLVAELPDARRAIISGAGGFPSWEDPAAVNAVVASFLEDRDGS